MRRALTLSMALPSLALANLGDWKLWTSVKTAHNAVARGQTILVATGGGVVEWSPTRTKQRVFTTLDGLPEINTISVLSDESGAVWAIGATGRIARLGPGASTWETTGSYAASGWTFNTAATAYWKNFLVLGGDQGLSLFSTTAKVAMDNISSIQGKTVKIASALVVNDTLWVGTDKGTAYCAPDSAGWAKAGTPGHYLSDPSRWNWFNTTPNMRMIQASNTAGKVPFPLWGDAIEGIGADSAFFAWKGGSMALSGANFGVKVPSGGYLVTSITQGAVIVDPEGAWKAIEVEGAFPFDPLPISVAMDPSGGLLTLCQKPGVTALAKRPAGSYSWAFDTLKVSIKDSVGNMRTAYPSWDQGETKRRDRIGMDVESSGRVVLGSWGNAPLHGALYFNREVGAWSMIGPSRDTCLNEAFLNGVGSIGSVIYATRARPDGIWISELMSSGIGELSQPYPLRIYHLPKDSDGPLACLDLPFSGKEFQTSDLIALQQNLWLATDHGIKAVVNVSSALGNTRIPKLTSPSGASSGDFFRLERYSLEGRDWIIAAGTSVLGLVDPISDTFYAAEGADQTYRSLAVDSKLQIWGAGNAGIDIFKVVLEQDTLGKLTPIFEKVRRITKNDGLPENEILDLRLDSASGKAILSTENTLVLWASPYRPVPKKLDASKIKVWPNPVRLLQSRTLFVDGVTEKAEFNLVAQDGTLVYHLASGRQTTGMFQIELPPSQNLRPGLYFWAVKDGGSVARGPLLVGH